MKKLDLTKAYPAYYKAKTTPETITLESVRYLSICGKGDPSGAEFAERIQALYSVAYAIKFRFKAQDKDFTVAKLEGQWWLEDDYNYDMDEVAQKVSRDEWLYRLLIRLPDYVKNEDIKSAKTTVLGKKKLELANEVEFFEMTEGKVVQILHVGPFSTEPESIRKIKDYCEQHGFKQNGVHHEIYLSNFNTTAPEKLKTILREPVK